MKIRLLVLHRKERHPGEFPPEAVAVVDEATMENNPTAWASEVERVKGHYADDSEIAAWADITLVVDDGDLMRALYPAAQIAGRIVSEGGDQ